MQSMLSDIFADAFDQIGLDRRFGQVTESARPDLGQFQCNGALAAAKEAKRNPREIAQQITERLTRHPSIESLSIAGPGFINILLKDAFLARYANDMLQDERLSCPPTSTPRTVIIDFGGPNVAKPMHVGHLRSSIIGDSLQRLLRYSGEKTIADNHLGDWGTQIGMLITELRQRNPQLPYFDEQYDGAYPEQPPVSLGDLEEMYPMASKRCKSNEQDMAEAIQATAELQQGRPGYVALWRHFYDLSLRALQKEFERLDIHFDFWLGESHYKQRMEAMVERLKMEGKAVASEGAFIIAVSRDDDLKEIPPLLIEKSGGGYLYGTSDLATIEERVERFDAKEIVYVVDKRQGLHFEQVFRAAHITRIAPSDALLVHVGFGTVNGPDGKPFKTREGGVMKLGDLVERVNAKALERMAEAGVAKNFDEKERRGVASMVGLAALKFADLSNHRESNYIFDIDKFTQFEGKTGPYLLYTTVRIKSILRNAAERGIKGGAITAPGDAERKLLLLAGRLPDVLRIARESYLPNYLCDFAFTLSQEFNRFYRDCHILSEKDRATQGSWISIIRLMLAQLELILGLLGIQTPERM
jgi:arginyl-tRNA synthetase